MCAGPLPHVYEYWLQYAPAFLVFYDPRHQTPKIQHVYTCTYIKVSTLVRRIIFLSILTVSNISLPKLYSANRFQNVFPFFHSHITLGPFFH